MRDFTKASELEVLALAEELANRLRAGDRVVLEGPMGAGKSTFARRMIQTLTRENQAEGSPTFAIAHEYRSEQGRLVHLDLYRVRSEEELYDAGIHEILGDPQAIVFVEWLSNWPEFAQRTLVDSELGEVYQLDLDFVSEDTRSVKLVKRS